jgi:hypothetical protein
MLGSAKPSVVAPALDPVDNQADHIAQDIADHTAAVAHTEDTAGTVEDTVLEDTADTAAVEDMAQTARSLFAVLHCLPKLGGRIRRKN